MRCFNFCGVSCLHRAGWLAAALWLACCVVAVGQAAPAEPKTLEALLTGFSQLQGLRARFVEEKKIALLKRRCERGHVSVRRAGPPGAPREKPDRRRCCSTARCLRSRTRPASAASTCKRARSCATSCSRSSTCCAAIAPRSSAPMPWCSSSRPAVGSCSSRPRPRSFAASWLARCSKAAASASIA